jgi:hypothetical protein
MALKAIILRLMCLKLTPNSKVTCSFSHQLTRIKVVSLRKEQRQQLEMISIRKSWKIFRSISVRCLLITVVNYLKEVSPHLKVNWITLDTIIIPRPNSMLHKELWLHRNTYNRWTRLTILHIHLITRQLTIAIYFIINNSSNSLRQHHNFSTWMQLFSIIKILFSNIQGKLRIILEIVR